MDTVPEVAVAYDDAFASPDALLRHTAAADAADAVAMLRQIEATQLLGYIVNQADMALHAERTRTAGIDAFGDLARAAIEVMGLPQDVLSDDPDEHEVFCDLDEDDDAEPDGSGACAHLDGADAQDDAFDVEDGEDADDPPRPWVTGWELVSVTPGELETATLALPVSPWLLGLVAFEDEEHADGSTIRRVVGAAADGRVATARLRAAGPSIDPTEDTEVLIATVSREPSALGPDARLAAALVAALRSAARGT